MPHSTLLLSHNCTPCPAARCSIHQEQHKLALGVCRSDVAGAGANIRRTLNMHKLPVREQPQCNTTLVYHIVLQPWSPRNTPGGCTSLRRERMQGVLHCYSRAPSSLLGAECPALSRPNWCRKGPYQNPQPQVLPYLCPPATSFSIILSRRASLPLAATSCSKASLLVTRGSKDPECTEQQAHNVGTTNQQTLSKIPVVPQRHQGTDSPQAVCCLGGCC